VGEVGSACKSAVFAPLDRIYAPHTVSSTDLLVHCIRLEVEQERQEEMIERCRSLTGAWAADRRSAAVTG
jgi:hypothetical protein